MKKHFTFLGFLLGILITTLSSCSTTQTFTVRGVPGTVISKDNMQIAVIDPSGQAQITLQRKNGYEHFLLAQAPNSNVQIPFALDYKNHNRTATSNICIALSVPIYVATLAGLMMCLVSGTDEELGKTGALIAVPGLLLGLPLIMYAERETINKDYARINYDYDYIKVQTTNNDLIR